MVFLSYIPQPPLAAFVELFWYFEGYAEHYAKERVLPTGDVQFVISLHDDALRSYDTHDTERSQTYHGPLVCGPHSKHSIIDTTLLATSMGVKFMPGGAFPFLGAPAGELHNLNVPLDALWGPAAHDLRDRLLEARTPIARFRILEQTLLGQAHTKARERHPAVTFALKEFQAVPQERTIAEVTKHADLSPKWFIEVFRAQVGLTPKLYCRLRRFQTALTRIGRPQQMDWTKVAMACGYFDQAHFIRDFRAFAGLSPTKYLADRTEHQNHVRLD